MPDFTAFSAQAAAFSLPGGFPGLALPGVALVLLGLLVLGVVLPAVWSRDPDRRRAAIAVLKLVLEFVRPRRTNARRRGKRRR